MFRPGELDEKICFYRETYVDDGIGGREVTTELLASNVWAKVRPLSGREAERFDQLNAEEMTLFVVRARCDIVEKDRILFDGVYYNIRRIPRRSKRAMYTEFYAERGVAL